MIEISQLEDKREWKGTEITFEVSEKGDQTEIRFTHLGLVPEYECFRCLFKRVGLLQKWMLGRDNA